METKFRISSLTKQFTAVCILKLEQEGKLSVNDKLSKYFPDFPKGDSVTIRMLLNHTSGIKNYTDSLEELNLFKGNFSKDAVIALFKNSPYDFSPGTHWKYSNSNYFLLGCIVEKVSGKSYSEYMYQNILKPLNMTNSGLNKKDSVIKNLAKCYYSEDGKNYTDPPYINMDFAFAAGSMYSTIEDLYKWDRSLYDDSIINKSEKQKMFTQCKLPDNPRYGYGIAVDTIAGHYCNSHSGRIQGFYSKFIRFPADDVCIIVMCNTSVNSSDIASGLVSILFDVVEKK